MLTYTGEFKVHWRTLVAACLGLALGAALNHYMTNLFGPPLIQEFGWEKSQFALIGAVSLLTIPFVPLAGRLVDRIGPRASAVVGFTVVPATFLAFSFMTGSITQFFAITIVQHIFGILTTSLVFCRVVVERFDRARGMALSVAMTGPPLIGAAAVPLVGEIVDAEGWRVGYQVLAAISAAGGFAAIALMGRRKKATAEEETPKEPARKLSRAEFLEIARNPAFLFLIGGMLLCNLPQVIVSSQLKLVLFENGVASRLATFIVSLYAIGVMIGRFISGFALDRIPAHIVAVFALGLPAIGFMVLASPAQASWVLAGAVLLVGLAQGAEGDVGAYITSRKFELRHYSFIYSFLIVSMGLASALGSLLLSATLVSTGNFNLFLTISAAVTILGALCFYLTGRYGSTHEPEAVPAAA